MAAAADTEGNDFRLYVLHDASRTMSVRIGEGVGVSVNDVTERCHPYRVSQGSASLARIGVAAARQIRSKTPVSWRSCSPSLERANDPNETSVYDRTEARKRSTTDEGYGGGYGGAALRRHRVD